MRVLRVLRACTVNEVARVAGRDERTQVRKLQDRTKEAADTAVEKARQVLGRAGEPSGPTAPTTASTPSAGTAGTPSTGATIFGSGASGPTRPY